MIWRIMIRIMTVRMFAAYTGVHTLDSNAMYDDNTSRARYELEWPLCYFVTEHHSTCWIGWSRSPCRGNSFVSVVRTLTVCAHAFRDPMSLSFKWQINARNNLGFSDGFYIKLIIPAFLPACKIRGVSSRHASVVWPLVDL